MQKDHLGEHFSLNVKRKEEHLEISSTGYGLESVSSTDVDDTQNKDHQTDFYEG